jgi:hypothetical protein
MYLSAAPANGLNQARHLPDPLYVTVSHSLINVAPSHSFLGRLRPEQLLISYHRTAGYGASGKFCNFLQPFFFFKVEEQKAAAMMDKPSESEEPVAVNTSFSEEQEALVLSAWDAMKADSAAIALKFFLRYRTVRIYSYMH